MSLTASYLFGLVVYNHLCPLTKMTLLRKPRLNEAGLDCHGQWPVPDKDGKGPWVQILGVLPQTQTHTHHNTYGCLLPVSERFNLQSLSPPLLRVSICLKMSPKKLTSCSLSPTQTHTGWCLSLCLIAFLACPFCTLNLQTALTSLKRVCRRQKTEPVDGENVIWSQETFPPFGGWKCSRSLWGTPP